MAVLLDSFGRKLEYLRVSVVDSCNHRCFYCTPDGACKPRSVRGELNIDKMVRAVAGGAAAGIRKVRLTGGEPLLRRDIVELVKEIAVIPGIEDLSLTTNGSMLTEMAFPLAQAGLKRVNISLDSLDMLNFNHITRGGKLQSTLDGIDAAYQAGLQPVKINMVVIKGVNDHEVADFARMTLNRSIYVRFIEYMPMFGQEKIWQAHYVPSRDIKELCEKALSDGRESLVPLTEEDLHGPARYFRYQGAPGRLGFITPVSQHFCAHCNRLRLTSDGKLKPCLFSAEEIDLLPALLKGEDLQPLYREAAKCKPQISEESPAARGSLCGPRGMVEIGG